MAAGMSSQFPWSPKPVPWAVAPPTVCIAGLFQRPPHFGEWQPLSRFPSHTVGALSWTPLSHAASDLSVSVFSTQSDSDHFAHAIQPPL